MNSVFFLRFLSGFIIFSTAAAYSSTSGLTFETRLIDLGLLDNQNDSMVSIPLRNTSKTPQVIAAIKPSCGCAGATIDGALMVNPGDVRNISVSLQTKDIWGPRNVDIVLFVEGSRKPEIVSLRGYSMGSAGAHFKDTSIDAGAISPDQERIKEFTVAGEAKSLHEITLSPSHPEIMKIEKRGDLTPSSYSEVWEQVYVVKIRRNLDVIPRHMDIQGNANGFSITALPVIIEAATVGDVLEQQLALGRRSSRDQLSLSVKLPSDLASNDVDFISEDFEFLDAVGDDENSVELLFSSPEALKPERTARSAPRLQSASA